MKRLINYLTKNGYGFKVCSYGSSYFFNVEPVSIHAVIITIGFNKEQATLYNKLSRYLSRYDYKKIVDGVNGAGYHIALTTNSNYGIYEAYKAAEKASELVCNDLIHKYNAEPLTIDLNHEVRKIMDHYGYILNNAIKGMATA